jgi:pyruvate,water dikinase
MPFQQNPGQAVPQDSGPWNPPREANPGNGRIPGGLDNEKITATGIKAMVSNPGEPGDSSLVDGVGMVRAEHMIADSGKHPFYLIRNHPEEMISLLITGLGRIARSYYPKPVWYRSVDVRSDEFRELEGGDHDGTENNPIMGWHGIRRSLDQPEFLRVEIEVIRKLRSEGLDNIVLGIPFITGVEQLRKVREMAGPGIRVGIMIETPAAGLEIENFCREGIEFAAIGLNDLTQLTLGVDRDNSRISRLYSEANPAVISLLKHILRTCRKHRVETSVYGDFVSDQSVTEALVRLGVGSIMAEPGSVEEIRSVISRTERKLILDSMRDRPSG